MVRGRQKQVVQQLSEISLRLQVDCESERPFPDEVQTPPLVWKIHLTRPRTSKTVSWDWKMWSDSRTTHLLVVGDAPDELIKVPVRHWAEVEMGNYSPYNPGVGLPQPLGTCLNR